MTRALSIIAAVPVLVVWGEKDFLVPVKDAHKFDELIPDSRLIIYDDTGHVPMIERPALFNRLLEDFLHQVESGRWTKRDKRSTVPSIYGPGGKP